MSSFLSSEQIELQESLRHFFNEEITSEYLRSRIESDQYSDPEFIEKIQSLGIFEYLQGNEDYQAGFTDLMVVARETGYALCPENLLPAFLSKAYLSIFPEDTENISFLCPEHFESGYEIKNNFLNGTARFVRSGNIQPAFLLCFPEGICCISQKQCAETCEIIEEHALDQSVKTLKIAFKKTSFDTVSDIDPSRLESIHDILLAAEVSGICERVTVMTVEYVKERKQFGTPVGAFQAVQHRIADMHLQSEALKSLVCLASRYVDESHKDLPLAAKSARMLAMEYGPEVVESAIQMHGGIGFTWEYDLHFFLRRVRSLSAVFSSGQDYKQSLIQSVNL